MGKVQVKVWKTIDLTKPDLKKRRMNRKHKRIDYPIINKYVYEPPYDNVLKYWRVVRYWVKRKYGITDIELEILLYLWDEQVFTKDYFINYEGILKWDKERWSRFRDKGWIIPWRPKELHRTKYLYVLSTEARIICLNVYKKLYQDEEISEKAQSNPIFKGDAYMDKMYRKIIRQMNKGKRDYEAELREEKEEQEQNQIKNPDQE